jgi:hypothetical protein
MIRLTLKKLLPNILTLLKIPFATKAQRTGGHLLLEKEVYKASISLMFLTGTLNYQLLKANRK